MKNLSDRFIWFDDEVQLSQCANCQHKTKSGATCTAFPQGIPQEILTNQFDHTQPYPGDNGIRFTPVQLSHD